MQVGVAPEETAVLIKWKKRTGNYALVRMKSEAILYASEGVGLGIIAMADMKRNRIFRGFPVLFRM